MASILPTRALGKNGPQVTGMGIGLMGLYVYRTRSLFQSNTVPELELMVQSYPMKNVLHSLTKYTSLENGFGTQVGIIATQSATAVNNPAQPTFTPIVRTLSANGSLPIQRNARTSSWPPSLVIVCWTLATRSIQLQNTASKPSRDHSSV
jgi:hypothetical protein